MTNVKFSNFVFSSSSVIGIYLGITSGNSTIYMKNVSFVNLEANGNAYGLIYISDSYNVIISDSTFENNINFIGLIHCNDYSYCDVSIKNSIFVNNIAGYGCLENLFYFEHASYATVIIKDNTFYGEPSIYYDDTSNVIIENNTIYPTNTCCNEKNNDLYLSSDGSDLNNNCTNENNPCLTFDYVISYFGDDSSQTLYISDGTYDIYDELSIDMTVIGIFFTDINYTIVGSGDNSTILRTDSSYLDLFYFTSSSSISFDTYVTMSDFTYFPSNDAYQRFGYFYYIPHIKFLNIIVNGDDLLSTYDSYIYHMITVQYFDSFIIENMHIYDMDRPDGDMIIYFMFIMANIAIWG